MFNSMYFMKVQEEETKRTGTYSEMIGYPEDENVKPYECCLLDKETGIVIEGSKVTTGQILVGKTRYLQQPNGKPIKKDYSKRYSSSEDCYVDKVYTSLNDEGGKVVKIRLRKHRIPEIGDKFASLAAQKGTTGQLLDQQDMPFTTSGIVPDFIINPHLGFIANNKIA
jgi:DNA-directed RNA polymerase beta subunit